MTADNIISVTELKERLIDFVYDAEGDIAIALEAYAAEKSKTNAYGIKQQNLTVDLFTTDGDVRGKTPVDIFLATENNLTTTEKKAIALWKSNFIGLFEIQKIDQKCYQLMNWLTAKTYLVEPPQNISEKELKRLQPGEIIVAIIAPLDCDRWFFFSDRVIKGKLSQPKLAVAIGEFRDNYPNFLYADAPKLLDRAWQSVAIYHQEFVDYFGSSRITLPGYKLNQKIGELQQKMSQKKLTEAGIDTNKSLGEMLAESGSNETEFSETAQDLGIDTQAIDKIISNKDKLSMVTPKVDLPPDIKQAESVTVFSDPKWGQMFLPNLVRFIDLLNSSSSETESEIKLLIRKYLELSEANYYVWQQLKQEYSNNLESSLQNYLDKKNFNIQTDLDNLLLEYDKSAVPELPAIASVPIHLNNLFEAAVAQVQKKRSKSKKKSKKKGFLSN